ncbi:ciliary microtubule associated protein 1B [Xenentodon cancila]
MQSDAPWVGTWRPHRPKGPIAALYGSPGPKYALPGLTGNFEHDPTKWKAPMFSFGGRHEEPNSNCSPGPRYLIPSNINRLGYCCTPAFSLHSRPKQPQLVQVPGPGQYSPEHSGKLTFRSAPAYSLTGRRKYGSNNNIPGPATYTLPPMIGSKGVAVPSARYCKLSGRRETGSFHEDLKKTPGPAAYEVVDPYVSRQRPPQYSMTGRNFVPLDNTEKPGPGAYYPERVTFTGSAAPSFTFGLRHSQYIAPLFINMD